MPRRKGARNYKNALLIRIIDQVLPNGELGWQAVATAYKEAAGEDTVQNSDNIKKHWIRNCCNGMKKPTRQPGGKNGSIHKCIGIEKLIMEKTNSRVYGLGDNSPSNSSSESDKSERRRGHESFDATRKDKDLDEEDDADRGDYASEDIAVPSFPGCEGMGDDFDAEVAEINTAHTEGDGGDRTTDGQVIGVNEPVTPNAAIGRPSSRSRPSTRPSPRTSTPDIVNAAIEQAKTAMKAQKTKNSSNKNRERKSVTSVI
jgi:hypothetical protein